jgi:hypothetical protein
VLIARCPEHGLHGERDSCFVCDGPVEQVPMVPINLLRSDRFLDRVLDKLTVAAGHPANTDALGLARWDLKAALDQTIREVYAK